MIQNVVLVEEAAQSDDNIFSSHAFRKYTLEDNVRDRRYLPPRSACSPDTRSICPYDWCTQAADAAVHVRMRVAGHDECSWPSIALFNHDLMSDASSSRIEVDTLLLRKLFNLSVLCQVLFRLVLDIVVKRHNNLLAVFDPAGSD